MLISFSVKTTAVAQGKEQNQKMTEVVTKRDSVMTVTGFRSLRATQLFLSVKTESACECRGGPIFIRQTPKGGVNGACVDLATPPCIVMV